MTYQRNNEVPEPNAAEPGQDQPLPAHGVWISLTDRLPPYDEDLRVLAHTGGSSFAGEEFFDIPALDLYAVGDSMTEIAEHATHWSIKPAPDRQHDDDRAVDHFAATMKAKLAKARLKGRAGWQTCSGDMLSALLRQHVEKGDPVDVAIFAMMLNLLGSEIKPAEAANDPRAAGNDPTPTADDLAAVARPFLALRVRTISDILADHDRRVREPQPELAP